MSLSSWKFCKQEHDGLVQAESWNIRSNEPSRTRRTSNGGEVSSCLPIAYCLSKLPAVRVRTTYRTICTPNEKSQPPTTSLREIVQVVLD